MGDLICTSVKAVIHKGENTNSFRDLTSQSLSVGALESGLCSIKAGNLFESKASVDLQGPMVL